MCKKLCIYLIYFLAFSFCPPDEVKLYVVNIKKFVISKLSIMFIEKTNYYQTTHWYGIHHNLRTENYHCNNNKVHFVGAILLHITNRCVTNTICFFKWTICILLDIFVDRTKRFVILTTDIVIVIFFKNQLCY